MGLETSWATQPHIFIELYLWPTTQTPKSIFWLWFELSGLAPYEDPIFRWNVKSPQTLCGNWGILFIYSLTSFNTY